MTEPDRFVGLERQLRAVLSEARPSSGASDDLRRRVFAIADAPPRSRLGRFVLTAGWAAAGSVAAAAAVFVLWFLGTRGTAPIDVPGAGASAPPSTFEPTRTGLGILTTVVPTLQLVPAMVTLSAIAVAIWLVVRYRSRRRRSGLMGAVAAVAVALGAVAFSQHPGFEWRGGSYAAALGLSVQADPAPGSGGVTTFYETAEPRGPYAVLVTLTNPGPLPIRLEGLVQPAPDGYIGPRWVALWLATGPDGSPGAGALTDARPFEPVEVAANGTVDLYLVGRAGSCAFGPTFSLGTSDVGGYVGGDRQIELAYSVFGLDRGGVFTLPFAVIEPVPNNCSG